MTPVERLIAAGIRPDCARETIMWFRAQGDDYGLEKYLNEVESRHANNGEVFLAQRMWETARLELFPPLWTRPGTPPT